MTLSSMIFVAVGAVAGSLLRFSLIIVLNPFTKTVSYGVLASNLLGACLTGILLALLSQNAQMSDTVRNGLTIGFLGGLTTFSAFTGELLILLQTSKFYLAMVTTILHVAGTLALAALFYYLTKLILSFVN